MIGGAVLAAGGSSRLGRPKQLVQREGRSLVCHVVQQLTAADVDRVAVVVGCRADQVAAALARQAPGPYQRLDNPAWADGIASSIARAVTWAGALGCEALLLTACDQPLVSTSHFAALCRTYRASGAAVASGYAAVRGIPALLPAAWFPRLLELRGDRGAGQLLRAGADVVVVPWPEGEIDIDTEADLIRAGITSASGEREGSDR